MLAANQNYNLSQCSLYKRNAFALVEVTGYSMHTVCLIVCESAFLLLTRCCQYRPAHWQFVVLKCVVCIQILYERLKICYWNTGSFKCSVCEHARNSA